MYNMDATNLIYQNVAGEADAMAGYEELKKVLDEDDVKIVDGIIAEETKHSLLLLAMAKRYNNVTADNDGSKEALNELSNGVQS